MIKAVERAYQIMVERNWDSIYWAIDLHGVCLHSTYEQGGYQWINDKVLPALKAITARPENKIILWSSCHPEEYGPIIRFFELQGIPILAFNENPEAKNTKSGNFDSKFYFSVLLDDKAGFDPQVHWDDILNYFRLKDRKSALTTGILEEFMDSPEISGKLEQSAAVAELRKKVIEAEEAGHIVPRKTLLNFKHDGPEISGKE